jgi:Dehydrogenases with different specificities (related to short-chain alcohol dehydrogenases)
MKFHTTVLRAGKTAAGVEVPEKIVLGLGGGKRPLVRVTLNGYSYRNAIAPRGDRYLLGISAEVRAASGVAGGDEVEVELEFDTAPREVNVPPELTRALAADPKAKAAFESLSYSAKKVYANPIEQAKTDETRQRNVEKAIKKLRSARSKSSITAVRESSTLGQKREKIANERRRNRHSGIRLECFQLRKRELVLDSERSRTASAMMNDGGRIVNISSGLTRFAVPGSSAYVAAKGGLEVLTRYMAKELGPRRITANVVAPGAIQTDFSGGMVRDIPEISKRVAEMTALGRAGVPDDVGPMIAALLSDENRWVNGQRIEVSGGMVL